MENIKTVEESKYSIAKTKALVTLNNYPYNVFSKYFTPKEFQSFREELNSLQMFYTAYKTGADFVTGGTLGNYIASSTKFKKMKSLLDKEARYMFSQEPYIQVKETAQQDKEKIEQYNLLLDRIFNKNRFSSKLLQAAKDCFVGKRVACMVDFSETKGVLIHFYNSKQFYYRTETESEELVKFVSVEKIETGEIINKNTFLVNIYEKENNVVYFESVKYNMGDSVKPYETIMARKQTDLKEIPAVVICNTGLLEDKKGVSEIEDLMDYEMSYSKFSNADMDSVRQGMNPVKYVVDMDSNTTGNLSTSAGSFWDIQSDQNLDNPHPEVGQIAPALNHGEALKGVLDRIDTAMHQELDVPNINAETMTGTITSGKGLQVLYFPLEVRCDEKMKVWQPCLEQVVRNIIDLLEINREYSLNIYSLSDFQRIDFSVIVQARYAITKDKDEEKQNDLAEIAQNTRSRKSYMRKWRTEEFETDEEIDEELLQIATELNMFDTMSMNTQVQNSLDDKAQEGMIDEI